MLVRNRPGPASSEAGAAKPAANPSRNSAGVLCFPVLALGGEIVIMAKPDLGAFLSLVESRGVTHTFLPPTLIYMLLGHPDLGQTKLTSL